MRGLGDVRTTTLSGLLGCVVSEHPHAGGCARRISLLFSLPRRRRTADRDRSPLFTSPRRRRRTAAYRTMRSSLLNISIELNTITFI